MINYLLTADKARGGMEWGSLSSLSTGVRECIIVIIHAKCAHMHSI